MLDICHGTLHTEVNRRKPSFLSEADARAVVARVAGTTAGLTVVFDTVRQTYGYAKQGAGRSWPAWITAARPRSRSMERPVAVQRTGSGRSDLRGL